MFALSEDIQQIRDLARDFARAEILPGAGDRDKSHAFPAELVAQLAEMGFLGMFVPEEYGGAGLNMLAYVAALEEVSYADASVGVIMSVQNSLAGWPILKFGTHEQKLKYLTPLATGERLGCYALTEPEAGSDAGGQKTKATPVEGGYRLNGSKVFITNGPQAEITVTYGNLDPASHYKGVCAFITESSYPGYSVGKIEDKHGITSSGTSELVFEDMFVPAENMLLGERDGFKVAMATLDGGRIGIAAQALGIAQRSLDLAVAYANERKTFGKPLSKHQAIQFKIADMATRIEASRLLVWKAAATKDAGQRASELCSMAKVFASETANFCAYEAMQIHGGYGYSREYEVERLTRDARITTIYEGTSEIQRLVIAKGVLS
ncbi:MAG: acyl-CoA dehydrogenase family protein [Deltaproteobacteria bacterium]|nr:acyl-CoA dehydrogenase family protein [Deltaproteobacteria bacterium]